MVLVDTSVWIDHLRKGNTRLDSLLLNASVLIHPFVIGELTCGNLKNRLAFLTLLEKLPMIQPARHEEVLFFIEHNQLMGRGIGYVDVHLLASLALSKHTFLWTRDKRLALVAQQLGMAYPNFEE